MSVPLVTELIRVGRRNRPGLKLDGPRYITIHDTGNPARGADAAMHSRYIRSDSAARRPASWHYTVDDHVVYKHLPLSEVGWHAGDGRKPGGGNMASIGIEICENRDGDRAKAEALAAKLVALLLVAYGLPVERVVQHNHWSGKDCPHILRHRPGGWDGFILSVGAEVQALGKEVK